MACKRSPGVRIRKDEWYAKGGFANRNLYRKQSRGGAWRYYEVLDNGDE